MCCRNSEENLLFVCAKKQKIVTVAFVFTATFYGIISAAILLFLLISFGIVILFCCGARRWQKSRSNFSMEPNPIYEIRGDIPTKNRFFMEQNPVYEIRGHIPTKNRFFMEQNPVYEIRGHIPTSKNIAYTATVL